MGLHFSRLALAVALAMQLATPLHAAEQLDEFYIFQLIFVNRIQI